MASRKPLTRSGRSGAVKRSGRIANEPLIIPDVIQDDETRIKISFQTTTTFQSTTNFLSPVVVEQNDVDKRSLSIRRAQQGMRADERKALIKDDFAYIFYRLAGDDEQLDPFELQRFMGMVFRSKFPKGKNFNLETCRSMVASVDQNKFGKVTFSQFKTLWMKLMKWQHIFNICDEDKDGRINLSEFTVTLEKLGIHLSGNQVHMIMSKFQNRDNLIELDDFLLVCCKVDTAKHSYHKGDIKNGNASLDVFLIEIFQS